MSACVGFVNTLDVMEIRGRDVSRVEWFHVALVCFSFTALSLASFAVMFMHD